MMLKGMVVTGRWGRLKVKIIGGALGWFNSVLGQPGFLRPMASFLLGLENGSSLTLPRVQIIIFMFLYILYEVDENDPAPHTYTFIP